MPSVPRPAPAPHPLREAAGLLGVPVPAGGQAVAVTGVTLDSRAVRPGDLYAALPGFATHGARFAAQAVAAGAAALLTDPAGAPDCAATGVPVLVVPDPRARLGAVSAAVYGHPADGLLLVGVTGTNGKTSLTHLLHAGLRAAGHVPGLVGTAGVRVGDEDLPAERTTPEAPDLHALLAVMRERGVTAVALEVSSHALALHRVDGLVVDVAVFTNLSRDHLDFHAGMEEYFAAKASLFTPARSRRGVVCVDDPWGRRLAAAAAVPVTTYAAGDPAGDLPAAGWTAGDVVPDATGSGFVARGPGGAWPVRAGLPGRFNVANTLGALAALSAAGCDPAAVAAALGAAPGAPGRLEREPEAAGFAAYVDYAHTPDAVARVLEAVRPARGRVLAVLGCGGDRDRDKRPQMGRAAAEGAAWVAVTDDNPRSEDPAAIRAAVLAGAAAVPAAVRAEVVEVPDRAAAIAAAVGRAGAGDVVVVLGKGHEQGQEVAGARLPFDDRAVLRAAVRARAGRDAARGAPEEET